LKETFVARASPFFACDDRALKAVPSLKVNVVLAMTGTCENAELTATFPAILYSVGQLFLFGRFVSWNPSRPPLLSLDQRAECAQYAKGNIPATKMDKTA